jgi:hypothetical protein
MCAEILAGWKFPARINECVSAAILAAAARADFGIIPSPADAGWLIRRDIARRSR